MTFQYYPSNVRTSKPLGVITLSQFIQAIKQPKPEIIQTFEQIRKCEAEGNQTEKARLKSNLYYFTPCVHLNGGRKYSDIVKFTGLMVLDFDHLEPDNAIDFKHYLFENYPFIISSWLSASRHGVRCLVNIPIVSTTDQFKDLFNGLAHYEMEQYNGFDSAPKNCVLPLFMSMDRDILFRSDSEQWDMIFRPLKSQPIKQYKVCANPSRVERTCKTAIDKITDNGHPQLRAISYALGGYVGSGFMSESDAVSMMHSMIEGNAYLSQKPAVYKKTATEMISKGQSEPLTFQP